MKTSLNFERAVKTKSRLRLALFGPSGSGKTFTALRMAKGLGSPVAVIDTERGSASKYADRFEFDVLDLEMRDTAAYIAAIETAHGHGYPILIIDSLTHAWHELLAEIEKIARARYAGNTWSAWSEGTPMQRRFVDALLHYPGHVIATMRTKTEWTLEKDDKGKTRPVRVGLAPEQGKGIEYEFDLLMELTVDHIGTVLKDRTGKYQDRIIVTPGEELGAELAAWLSEGIDIQPANRRPNIPALPEPTLASEVTQNDEKRSEGATATTYWTMVMAKGMNREQGLATLEQFGKDFGLAEEHLKSR